MMMEQPGVLDGAIAPVHNSALFGHEAQEDFLARAYRSGKLHHALLIEGPQGVGKATLAFRFAQHVLSHPDPQAAPETMAAPDPESPIARQLASGASHNLLHITRPVDEKTGKVKTAITIEEIRRVGHFFSQTSGTGNWRIVIIDPADDMNRNAANAVLKVLEEPPKRSLFLVLSHAPGKLLPTIRSRCLPLKLSALQPDDLLKAIGHLGLAVHGDQKPVLVDLAKGSVSQALKLINYGGADIIAAFREVLSSDASTARRKMHKLADALSGKDGDVVFQFFLDHLTEYLMQMAKDAAMTGNLVSADRLSHLTSDLTQRLVIAGAYNLDRKQTILDVLVDVRAC
ncbi:DNA polymerase III subunit delta' [Allorhizobium undicola]|uniref:DNA polymerase III subunit delta' n=1 Tax=Allorhizobium undicola TaxID=78527 RepID=UPI00048325A6|nr:DNA polymerase III subunit delta' [Allorhizobium undicola]